MPGDDTVADSAVEAKKLTSQPRLRLAARFTFCVFYTWTFMTAESEQR